MIDWSLLGATSPERLLQLSLSSGAASGRCGGLSVSLSRVRVRSFPQPNNDHDRVTTSLHFQDGLKTHSLHAGLSPDPGVQQNAGQAVCPRCPSSTPASPSLTRSASPARFVPSPWYLSIVLASASPRRKEILASLVCLLSPSGGEWAYCLEVQRTIQSGLQPWTAKSDLRQAVTMPLLGSPPYNSSASISVLLDWRSPGPPCRPLSSLSSISHVAPQDPLRHPRADHRRFVFSHQGFTPEIVVSNFAEDLPHTLYQDDLSQYPIATAGEKVRRVLQSETGCHPLRPTNVSIAVSDFPYDRPPFHDGLGYGSLHTSR